MSARVRLRVVVIAFFAALGVSVAQAQSFLGSLTGSRPVPVDMGTSAELYGQSVPAKTSFSTDHSDLWGTPTESGWGVQLVQQADVIFATMFIYGLDGRPTWYIATLLPDAPFSFSGAMIATTGSYFGAVWNPATVTGRTVGTMSLVGSVISTKTLMYTIDGVTVTKTIQRTTLRFDNYDGNYQILIKGTNTGCGNPAENGNFFGTNTATVLRNAAVMTITFGGPPPEFACSFVGTYAQSGKFGQLNYAGTCTDGTTSSGSIFEMSNRIEIMSARLTGTDSTGCSFTGRFTGLMP